MHGTPAGGLTWLIASTALSHGARGECSSHISVLCCSTHWHRRVNIHEIGSLKTIDLQSIGTRDNLRSPNGKWILGCLPDFQGYLGLLSRLDIYYNPDPLNILGWWGGWPMNELLVKALSPKWDLHILGISGILRLGWNWTWDSGFSIYSIKYTKHFPRIFTPERLKH